MLRALRPWIPAFVAVLLGLWAWSPASAFAPASGLAAPSSVPAVPGELLVQLTSEAHAASYDKSFGSAGRTGAASVDRALALLGATHAAQVFAPERDAAAKRASGLDRVLLIRYSGKLEPKEAARRLQGVPGIAYAEPNFLYRALLAPNDPMYPSQWAHRNTGQAISYGGGNVGTPDCDTDTDQAWDLQTGSSTLIVAIIDTGVDTGHPEFAGRVVPGWDFVNADADPADDHGHGTGCAGLALGAGNNSQGIAGVAWNVKLMPVKVIAFDGWGSTDDVAAGITFAADNGARIQSLSLGGPISSTLGLAVDYAANTKGCALFCAAGNADVPYLDYPAAYSACIGVGAMSPCNQRKNPTSCDGETWWGSNWGIGLQFMAPGVRIHTADIRGAAGLGPDDYLTTFNGTSSATPHAAGIGALVWSQAPSLTNWQVLNALRNNCDDIGAAGWDSETAWGRLNAYRALLSVGAGSPVTIFSEGFETNPVPGTVWGANDANGSNGADYWGAQTSASGARVHGGAKSAYCAQNSDVAGQKYDNHMQAYLTKSAAVNVAGYVNTTFSFWHWYKTYNASDYLALQFWNGSAWVEQQRWSGAGTGAWVKATYAISGFTTFQWRWLFFSDNSKTSEGAYIDDVLIEGIPGGSAVAAPMTVALIEERAATEVDLPFAAEVSAADGAAAEAGSQAGERRSQAGVLLAAPNPMRGATTLSWTLEVAADVRLEIFAVNGRRVAVLKSGVLPAGAHSAAWTGRDGDGRALANGVYHARLTVDGQTRDTQRLVFLRP